jgi:hypothetical protein
MLKTEIPDFKSPARENICEGSKPGLDKKNAESDVCTTPPSLRMRQEHRQHDDVGSKNSREEPPVDPGDDDEAQANGGEARTNSSEVSVESPELMRGGGDDSERVGDEGSESESEGVGAASEDVFEAALAFVRKLQASERRLHWGSFIYSSVERNFVSKIKIMKSSCANLVLKTPQQLCFVCTEGDGKLALALGKLSMLGRMHSETDGLSLYLSVLIHHGRLPLTCSSFFKSLSQIDK